MLDVIPASHANTAGPIEMPFLVEGRLSSAQRTMSTSPSEMGNFWEGETASRLQSTATMQRCRVDVAYMYLHSSAGGAAHLAAGWRCGLFQYYFVIVILSNTLLLRAISFLLHGQCSMNIMDDGYKKHGL